MKLPYGGMIQLVSWRRGWTSSWSGSHAANLLKRNAMMGTCLVLLWMLQGGPHDCVHIGASTNLHARMMQRDPHYRLYTLGPLSVISSTTWHRAQCLEQGTQPC